MYEGQAIGFDGQPFLNLAVSVETELGVGEMARRLRHIEYEHGRPRNASRFSSRQLDIDILTYDDIVGVIEGVELPRGEILENAFVLRPLAELAPQLIGQDPTQLLPLNEQMDRVLKGHGAYVQGVAYSPDGTLLASASRRCRASSPAAPARSPSSPA